MDAHPREMSVDSRWVVLGAALVLGSTVVISGK